MKKVAASEWAVGKLLAMILLGVVLILVIYGISTGGFKPLEEKLKGQFDSVLILFKLKEGGNNSVDCLRQLVSESPDGMSVLNELGLNDNQNIFFDRCKGYCNFNGEYFFQQGKLYKYIDGKNGNEVGTFDISAEQAKFYWTLYNGLMDEKYDGERKISDYFKDRMTEQFILRGKKGNQEVYAIWQNGYWLIKSGAPVVIAHTQYQAVTEQKWSEVYAGEDSEKAINSFAGIVEGGFLSSAYVVDYATPEVSTDSLNWNSIDALVVGNDNGKLDANEASNLKTWFSGFKNRQEKIVAVSSDEEEKVKSVEGKEINVDGKIYKTHVVVGEGSPYFELLTDFGDNYTIISYANDLLLDRMDRLTTQNANSTELLYAVLKYNNRILENASYSRDKKTFDEYYKNTVIKDFLSPQC